MNKASTPTMEGVKLKSPFSGSLKPPNKPARREPIPALQSRMIGLHAPVMRQVGHKSGRREGKGNLKITVDMRRILTYNIDRGEDTLP